MDTVDLKQTMIEEEERANNLQIKVRHLLDDVHVIYAFLVAWKKEGNVIWCYGLFIQSPYMANFQKNTIGSAGNFMLRLSHTCSM